MYKIFLFTFLAIFLVSCKSNNKQEIILGAMEVIPTSLEKGSLFISTNGSGNLCSHFSPCDLATGLKKVSAGDIVFFKGGIYDLSTLSDGKIKLTAGQKDQPIQYESYPNELAIFDGINLKNKNGSIHINDYTILRRIEIRNMPEVGIKIRGNYNSIEGVITHHNQSSGIHIFSRNGYVTNDEGGSYNRIQNCISHHNSDANLSSGGNGADGISISSGMNNTIIQTTVYSNSDDGIDVWKSINSHIESCVSYDNGKGPKGNGVGFKLGGDMNASSLLGRGAVAQYNIAYDNRNTGFSDNFGKEVIIKNNTAYKNGKYGFESIRHKNALISNNIAYANHKGDVYESKTLKENNSWQIKKVHTNDFRSLNPASKDFLKLTEESNLSHIGAYVKH